MRRLLSRMCLAVLLSAVLIVSAVLPAAADGPVYREFWPVTDFTIDGLCDFQINGHIERNNSILTIWERQDGTVVWRWTGAAMTTWTNAVTGYSLSANLSGPQEITYYPDGSSVSRWVGPQTVGPGFTWGLGTATFGPGGEFISWELHGRNELFCDALNH